MKLLLVRSKNLAGDLEARNCYNIIPNNKKPI